MIENHWVHPLNTTSSTIAVVQQPSAADDQWVRQLDTWQHQEHMASELAWPAALVLCLLIVEIAQAVKRMWK